MSLHSHNLKSLNRTLEQMPSNDSGAQQNENGVVETSVRPENIIHHGNPIIDTQLYSFEQSIRLSPMLLVQIVTVVKMRRLKLL